MLISEQINLAFNPAEPRDVHGRWTGHGWRSPLGAAGPGTHTPAKAFEFIGPHGSLAGAAFLPGNHEPEVGDMARSENNVVGRVISKAGGHAVVDGDDGNRYLVDWRNGGEVRQAGPAGEIMHRMTPQPSAPYLGGPGHLVAAKDAAFGLRMRGASNPPDAEALLRLYPPDRGESPADYRERLAVILAPPPPKQPSAPGVVITSPGVKQYILPGMETAGTSEYGHNSAPVQKLAKLFSSGKLLRAMTPGSGEGKVTWPEQGAQGATAIVKIKGIGNPVISKSQAPDRNDREELSYYVAQAIGSNLPAVARSPDNPRDILMNYVPGTTGARYLDSVGAEDDDPYYARENAASELQSTSEGQNIGLLDYLTSNPDRHDANWMVSKDGVPVPIDMGSAQFDADDYGSPFWSGVDGDWDASEVADIRRNLAKIQPEFIRLGHPDWYANMIESLERLSGNSIAGEQYRDLLEGLPDRATSLSNSIARQVLDLGWRYNPAEARDAHGKWTRSGEGYLAPDHARLFNPRSPKYKDPADHPFFKRNPVSAANVVKAYDASTPGEKAQGMRWYADAHDMAADIADGDATKGAAVLAAYSPQTSWPVNMMNAARSIKLGRALGPGEGMITGAMQRSAQKVMDGAPIDQALPSPKTNAFAHLIAHGGDEPAERLGHVVIDRHAMSVAAGRRLSKVDVDDAPIDKPRFYEHVADQYRLAALELSRRGTPVSPHQLQAITWLHQQAANTAGDLAGAVGSGGARLGKGRQTSISNAWNAWNAWAGTHGVEIEQGTTALSGSIAGQVLSLAAWEHELRDAHGRWARSVVSRVITAAEARGDSRPVSHGEFQRLAAEGLSQLAQTSRDRAPATGLDQHWAEIKAKTYVEVQQPWGGATINAHTGEALATDADKYALTVKPEGMHTVSVPEHASLADFEAAMDRALAQFRPEMEKGQRHLGIFHDDDNHRIDIDPVLVVDDLHSVETIGAYTHAIGGAYHFRSGDGFWPPHVAEGVQMSNESRPHFAGPGQWRSAAAQVQSGLTQEQQAEIEHDGQDEPDGDDGEPAKPGSVTGQVLGLAGGWHDAWRHETRGPHGEWAKGAADSSPGYEMPGMAKRIRLYLGMRSFPVPVASHLQNAARYAEAGDPDSARKELASASTSARRSGYPHNDGDVQMFRGFARQILAAQNQADIINPNTELAKAITGFTSKAAPKVLSLVGGKKEGWDGKVTIPSKFDSPGVLADIGWDGHMRVRKDVAQSIKTALDMYNEPVNDPGAFSVILHELIHGVYDGDGTYQKNEIYYQDPPIAAIEEGSTELGAIQHAPDFFDAMGIGDRQTEISSDNPEDLDAFGWAITKHATMSEYARRLQDAKRIADGDAWGHYAGATAAMQEWVQQVAQAEAHAAGRGFDARGPGSPDWARVVELTDEINRQGAAGKLDVMAAQIGRALGGKNWALSDEELDSIKENIREGFDSIGSPDGKAAFRNAARAHAMAMKERV